MMTNYITSTCATIINQCKGCLLNNIPEPHEHESLHRKLQCLREAYRPWGKITNVPMKIAILGWYRTWSDNVRYLLNHHSIVKHV